MKRTGPRAFGTPRTRKGSAGSWRSQSRLLEALTWVLALGVLLVGMAFWPRMDARAQDDEPELLPELVLDRIDGNRAVWRLSTYVQTAGGGPPNQPAPVYIQFGFMGCVPCERLAGWANEELSEEVQMVYIHLDDVLLQPGLSPRQLWMQLYEYSQAGPYERFTTARRGHTSLMQQLCGETAAAPSALLVLPSGQVFSVLLSPSEDDARAQFRAFMEATVGE